MATPSDKTRTGAEDPHAELFGPGLLKDRVILVTGGGTGLGRTMARRFARLGARILLGARREEPLRETVDELLRGPTEAAYRVTDVRDPESASKLVEEAFRRWGRLDVVVNNAAGNFLARTERLSPNAFDTVVRTVLMGTFYVTQAAGRGWIERQEPGVVLNIVTSYAWTGAAHVVPSASAKAGVLALTRSLAVEWARHRIRLNALAPGPIPTPGAWERLLPTPELEERIRRHIPSGRFGRHEELADLATFLVSDLSSFITGQVITLDGGEWLVGNAFQALREVPESFWEGLEARHREARGSRPPPGTSQDTDQRTRP